MSFGVTEDGFVKKTYEDLRSEMESSIRASLGNDIDLSDESPDGQILNIVAEGRSQDWDTMEDTYYSMYPNTSNDISLDNASQATNSEREDATYSTTTLEFTGLEGSTIPSDTVCETSTGIQVVTTSTVEIALGETTVEAPARADEIGDITALAGTITTIVTPVSGITDVINTTDLVGGKNEESDGDFRVRRVNELQRPGTASVEGIRNELLDLDYISKALVIENVTDITDSDDRPPHSIECFVTADVSGNLTDPANDDKRLEIAETIFDSKAGGIQTYGDITETVTDSQGFTHEISFSEPEPVTITVVATVEENQDSVEGPIFPSDGEDQIKESILEYGDSLGGGQDVWLNKVSQAISEVDGVKGITSLTLNGSTANVIIASTEISSWSSTNITITVI